MENHLIIGIKCVENFDGMFAFSIFDTTKKMTSIYLETDLGKAYCYFFNKIIYVFK